MGTNTEPIALLFGMDPIIDGRYRGVGALLCGV